MAPVRTLTRAEEFATICDHLGTSELVRGEVVKMSPGGYAHSRISIRIAVVLENWATASDRGRVIGNEAGLIVETDPDTVRGADVAYYSYDRLPRDSRPQGFLRIPPDLVVEVMGTGQTWGEMVEKAAEYLRFGADRVWLVDPDSEQVHIYRADAQPVILTADNRLTDETILPGFSSTVRAFFE